MTLKQIAQELEDDELFAERMAVDAVRRLAKIRKDRKAIEDDEQATALVIKEWFLRHPDETELVDRETGYRAFLRSGGTTKSYDVPAAIQKRDKSLYARLKELGVFKQVLDVPALEKAIKDGQVLAVDMAAFTRVGERSPSLMVEQK